MTSTTTDRRDAPPARDTRRDSGDNHDTRDLDVLIVGAGLSGIGAAYHLKQRCPHASVAIVEARDAIGGTWDLFRYPGVRSDSDMFTLGYSFRPWHSDKAISDGQTILDYIRDTARAYGIDKTIRYGQKVVAADWDSNRARWTVRIERTRDGATDTLVYTCRFLFMCSGYYDYDAGYLPDWAGMDTFEGQLVHPQHWPKDLSYANRRVVVIGSGATAVTLVPSMAADAQHVTMLQRSPTYIVSLPARDKIANALRRVLPSRLAHRLVRVKNVLLTMYLYNVSRRKPDQTKKFIIRAASKQLGPDFDVAKHLTPRYMPWDQRVCLVPNGDLFKAIRAGRASIVTDEIERFTPTGLQLKSGQQLDADVIVTATGLKVKMLGGARVTVDGRRPRGRFAGDGVVQGDDVQRRAEPRIVVRLHECVVDAEGRADRALRVPAAQPHARERVRHVRAAARRGRSRRRAGRQPELGLHPARGRHPAEAGASQAVEIPPELRARSRVAEVQRARRFRDAIRTPRPNRPGRYRTGCRTRTRNPLRPT